MIELNQFVMDKRFHNQANTDIKDSISSWSNSRAPFFQKNPKQAPDKPKANPQLKITLVTVVSVGEKHT